MDLPRHTEISKAPGFRAFTLVELLVVVAVVAMLIALRLPALAGARIKSGSAQCLNNQRQLSLAWLMYAGDNHDNFLCSSDDGAGSPYVSALPANVHHADNYAWTWSKMDYSTSGYNWDPAADIKLRLLWNYTRNTSIYRCPADTSAVKVNGTAIPRVRSYSMNWFLGGLGENSTDLSDSPNAAVFPFFTKLTDLQDPVHAPGAANTFLFIEERPDCINWGNFETDMTGYPANGHPLAANLYEWQEDLPAFYHNFASALSFVDGHCEIHRWQGDAGDTLPVVQGMALTLNSGTKFPAPYSADVAYMQNISTRPTR